MGNIQNMSRDDIHKALYDLDFVQEAMQKSKGQMYDLEDDEDNVMIIPSAGGSDVVSVLVDLCQLDFLARSIDEKIDDLRRVVDRSSL